MGENLSMIHSRRPFVLPTGTVLTMYHNAAEPKYVAHSLDFDLVCVGESEEEATKNIVLAVKTYIEFGLSSGWGDEIYFPAPQEFWEKLTPDTPIKIGPAISVDDKSMCIFKAEPLEAVAA